MYPSWNQKIAVHGPPGPCVCMELQHAVRTMREHARRPRGCRIIFDFHRLFESLESCTTAQPLLGPAVKSERLAFEFDCTSLAAVARTGTRAAVCGGRDREREFQPRLSRESEEACLCRRMMIRKVCACRELMSLRRIAPGCARATSRRRDSSASFGAPSGRRSPQKEKAIPSSLCLSVGLA